MKVTRRSTLKSNGYSMTCSTELKKEHFTLTPSKHDPKAGRYLGKAVVLSIGYSVADFIDADDTFIQDAVAEAKSLAGRVNVASEADRDELVAAITVLQDKLWSRSPIFGALVGELYAMSACARHGERYDVKRLKGMDGEYISLRERLKNIVAKCFEGSKSEDLRARYLDLQNRNESGFTTLVFGNVELGYFHDFADEEVVPFRPNPNSDTEITKVISLRDTVIPTEVLRTECVEDVVNFLVYKYLSTNLRMKRCKYCGRYFGIVDSYHSEYCDRRIEGSVGTCKALGSVKLYEQKLFESPAVREYKRSYKAHNSRVRYGSMTREEFSAWSKEARAMRDKCVAGEITLKELTAWLDSDRRR